ncbi:hypothetical protein SAMN05660443_0851 [Marinospirillum celere]|uniref:Pyridoxamine 5'-phosphate oxidase N-terminal domain-containing protein n=1 Tax=Marinospirillum celere TaxID=1122252 RepID=A0A1I1EV86_9GAMM|nr:pyridoxamine 5'-phosphate oxidase family protein [Marinospirillum celere]SFB90592.1 hypothetical protein SAMN05660443_0851 [Marinospirillum celere]
MTQQPDLETVKADYLAFIQAGRACMLATTSPEGLPEASYAPCFYHQGSFYIFVSELASHTRNLLQNPHASLLLTESQPRNLFACKRATLQVLTQPLDRNSTLTEDILNQMQEHLGDTLALLKQLQDFHLIQLQPQKASYVTGFGKAFELQGQDLKEIAHIRPG